MEILMIVPRQKDIEEADYNYTFPIGLGYVSSCIKKSGYNLDSINLNHYKGGIEFLINKALDKKIYDVVCTGHITMGYQVMKKIIKIIKNHKSRPKIILGGVIVTSEPKTIFNLLNPDYAVIGEGEETIIELLKCIEKKENIKKIKGIIFRDKNGNTIITKEREAIQNLDSIPFPDFEGLDFKKYLDNLSANFLLGGDAFDYPRIYQILGSRGCPFNCTFCYHWDKYRKRSINNIMKELYYAVNKYKINYILFQDECLALDKKRLYELCKRMKKLQEDTPWDLKWTSELTVRDIDEATLKKMKESGLNVIGYGFESFSPTILKSMKKPITPELINNAFNLTMKTGLGIQANFIFGDIAETKETAKETLNWWKKMGKGQINLGIISPYPGSEIYKHCLKKGIIKNEIDFIENRMTKINHYNMTDKMSDKEWKQLEDKMLVLSAKYNKYADIIVIKKIKENRYTLKVKCPFCGEKIIYENCFIKNKNNYDFNLLCRKCNLRFFAVDFKRKFLYNYYYFFIFLKDYLQKIYKILNKI